MPHPKHTNDSRQFSKACLLNQANAAKNRINDATSKHSSCVMCWNGNMKLSTIRFSPKRLDLRKKNATATKNEIQFLPGSATIFDGRQAETLLQQFAQRESNHLSTAPTIRPKRIQPSQGHRSHSLTSVDSQAGTKLPNKRRSPRRKPPST